ncbi:uracil phosphoribosyltransferase [Candidatus Mycoplasma haematominutum]|uniref:Uracil phosphoribosyltransferase n=1 Tax=Candidatus Mycoplasma haematominutum 'Birmingham 1' TaxID=1116213 RepID=G8C407_9MOLU|nr:uracil phosphoribosyltransferase [Candidatus Mycoplasma haematominutum]CCE67055.1 uracil phosphoribosyltransferase [Candidatus Mycoplasma haematominutum 'Birmingham 1']
MSVFVVKNNFVDHFIGRARNQQNGSTLLRENLKKITWALAFEAHKEFVFKNKEIQTPISSCNIKELSGKVVVVPILRSGLVMSDALQFFFENCSVVHLGIYRDENLRAIKYYEKFPENLDNSKLILCDPLIATGSTILKSLDILSKYNFKEIIIMGIIFSQQAIDLITGKYPEINIYAAAIDPQINSHGYIVPGLGDAGNRLFNTD